MKRRAPQTLLEFSEYILPIKRLKVVHLDPDSPPHVQVIYEEVPVAVVDNENERTTKRSDEDCGTADWPLGSRNNSPSTKSSSIMQDFHIGAILGDDLLAKKPFSCREPITSFVEAVKWLIDNRNLIQREVAYELDVSPSTLSLYLNGIERKHGWRELELKIYSWLRAQLSA